MAYGPNTTGYPYLLIKIIEETIWDSVTAIPHTKFSWGGIDMTRLKVNQSYDHRMARITIGVFVIAVGIALDGTWGIVLGVVGLVPLSTGTIGWCPLYVLFKKSSENRSDN